MPPIGNSATLIGHALSQLAEARAADRREIATVCQAFVTSINKTNRPDEAAFIGAALILCSTLESIHRSMRIAFVYVALIALLRAT